MGSLWRAVNVATAVALGASACISVHTENVTYGPGRVRSPGYSVEYLDATPRPGTPVVQGTVVRFSIKVRYSLLKSDRGKLQLQFADQHGQPLLVGKETAVKIARAGSAVAEVSQEVVIPAERWDLVAYVLVVPDDEAYPVGELRIRYPVAEPSGAGRISK